MRPENSHDAADWLRIAEKDLGRVERCLAADDPELAGFCLQQATEKFLKAFLLSRGWSLRRIHDLEALLDDAAKIDSSLGEFRNVCQRITTFYMLERYPLPVRAGLSEAEIRPLLQAVLGLAQKIREALH